MAFAELMVGRRRCRIDVFSLVLASLRVLHPALSITYTLHDDLQTLSIAGGVVFGLVYIGKATSQAAEATKAS